MKTLGYVYFVIAAWIGLSLSGCGESHAIIPTQSLSLAQFPKPLSPDAGYKVLYRFKSGNDGAIPEAPVLSLNGALYGTTSYGGGMCNSAPSGCGTVFVANVKGGERVLTRFKNYRDGAHPYAGLIGLKGALYGTTSEGGTNIGGTVYSVSISGKERLLHSFQVSDGEFPIGNLTVLKGTLYGVTWYGGGESCVVSGPGCGTVFAVSTSGKERIVHAFDANSNSKDGARPESGLIADNGNLYGTTTYGGAFNAGTVFEVTPSGKERILHSFSGGTADGWYPVGKLALMNGELYGTASNGGAKSFGVVFALSTSGKERVLYSFEGGKDGAFPGSGLAMVNGALYGTTPSGGDARGCPLARGSSAGCGTVFKLTAYGAESVLYRFAGGNDGSHPGGPLTSVNGILYGTTATGGGSGCASYFGYYSVGCGTLFQISP